MPKKKGNKKKKGKKGRKKVKERLTAPSPSALFDKEVLPSTYMQRSSQGEEQHMSSEKSRPATTYKCLLSCNSDNKRAVKLELR